MNTVLTFDAITPSAPEGIAPFKITGAYLEKNIKTDWGLRDRAVIEFTLNIKNEEGSIEIVVINSRYLVSNYKKSAFYKFVLDALDRPIGKRFDLKDLIGVSGMAKIVHNTTEDGDTYANIGSIQVNHNITQGTI